MSTRSRRNLMRAGVFDASCFAYLVVTAFTFLVSSDGPFNLGFYSVIFGGAFAFGLGLSFLFLKRKWLSLGHKIFLPAHLLDGERRGCFWIWQLVVALVVTLYVGGRLTHFSVYDLFDEDGFNGAVRLFSGLASPNWQLLPEAVLKIIETVFMAFLATFIAIPFAFVLSFLCAKNVMTHPVAFVIYFFLRTSLNVVRSIEALIWAIIFSVWVGIGPFAGMMALMIHSIASLAKQYSEMVESVSSGPIEGIRSTGANPLQVIWFGIVPQVVLPYISFTVYRWDINVRMATIIGLVGGGGIGTLLIKFQGQAMWGEVGCIILVIAVVVWIMDQTSTYIREAIK